MRAERASGVGLRALALAALGVVVGVAAAAAQGADTVAVPGSRSCTLILLPRSDSTRMVSHRVGPDQYVTHVGGGLRWTCGSARMAADSGIKYDREHKLEMVGAVDYRDSVRTLTADSLAYWQNQDRIVAYGRVRLVRLATKSVLTGPRVEFFRSGAGGKQRTVATGRPHLTVPDTTGKGPPAEIDADRMVFVGESEARMRGDVRIVRGKTRTRSDSAVYLADAHEGRLLGSPVVTSEDFRLSGSVISAVIDSGRVRTVTSRGEAQASGESFRLFADAIDARVAGEQIERLWAHGTKPALAVSAPYRLDGDSLVFAFREGDIDSLISVGHSSAVEVGDTAADTIAATARGTPPPARAGSRNWVRGDTLQLAFASPDTATASADSTAVDTTGVPPGATPRTGTRPDTAATADTGEVAAGDTTPGGAGQHRVLKSIRAAGAARAYYLVPRDSAEGGGDARNYLIGKEIIVRFADGQARRVTGHDAIGVFLDPNAPGQNPTPAPAAPAGAAPVRPDTGSAAGASSASGTGGGSSRSDRRRP